MDLFTYLVPGSDGTCRALREAAALGLPLVGTRRGAIPEIIVPGETGLLVEPESARALAAGLGEVLADPARYQRTEKARAVFDEGRSLDEYESLLERLAGSSFA